VLDDCDTCALRRSSFQIGGLRDNKVRVVYLTLTRREPGFLRDDTPEFEELFELLSSPGHTLPVAPYVETDALLMLRRLAARQVPPRPLSEAEGRRFFDLSGGHAGLLRALFFATQYTPELAAVVMSPTEWVRLADHADVEGECRKIWDSLEVEEQADLRRLARQQAPSAEGLRRLERRGLARAHFNRAPELFSPVFERCLKAILGEGAPAPQRCSPRCRWILGPAGERGRPTADRPAGAAWAPMRPSRAAVHLMSLPSSWTRDRRTLAA
jgi:hypothetical protein